MRSADSGVALMIVVMAMLLMAVIGAALVLATSIDVVLAANAGASSEALYAADAAFERTVAELQTITDLSSVLSGSTASAFRDGAASGRRVLADGSVVSLDAVLNLANCQKRTGCADADMNASLRHRPWGDRNPRWRLFSHGPFDAASGGTDAGPPLYVLSMVADDPAEIDTDPARDGGRPGSTASPGAGIILVRAEAFGRRGSQRVVQGVVLRPDLAASARWDALDPATRGPAPAAFPVLQVLAWEEIR